MSAGSTGGYRISVSVAGVVSVNGQEVGSGAPVAAVLAEVRDQINGYAQRAAAVLTVMLADDREGGAGYRVFTASPDAPLPPEFDQMGPAARAALDPGPAWARVQPGARLSRARRQITRSITAAAPELVESRARADVADQGRRRRRAWVLGLAAIALLLVVRALPTLDWTGEAYAAVCEDIRTGLRIETSSTCGESRFHDWRYFEPGAVAPAVGEMATAGIPEAPEGARTNEAFPVDGGTVNREGLSDGAN